jgi:hypothetical protein
MPLSCGGLWDAVIITPTHFTLASELVIYYEFKSKCNAYKKRKRVYQSEEQTVDRSAANKPIRMKIEFNGKSARSLNPAVP